jgi:replicative DNA helicase
MGQVVSELAELPLIIDDMPALSIQVMRDRARQMKRQYGISLLVVDYLQLITSPNRRGDQTPPRGFVERIRRAPTHWLPMPLS